jgi:membrane protease YdiL (CAAX protease family)
MALMWCPGLSAIVTKLLFREPLGDLGWRWGRTRYQLASYALPVAYSLAAYVPVWLLGLGRFYDHEFVGRVAARFGLDDASPVFVILVFVLFQATVGALLSCVFALGEEIGWRGFLVPELDKAVGFRAASIISGVIWSVWHYPLLIFADYNAGTPTWYGLTCFTVMVVAASVAYAWLRLRSGSLWTGTILHGSHNLFVQGVFDPLTLGVAVTPFIIGEFGAALAIVSVIVAVVFLRMAPPVPAGDTAAASS